MTAPETRSPSPLDKLAQAVARMPRPAFAAVDGAHFDDISTILGQAGLAARSLFLADAERDVRHFGPWLVPITQPDDIATLFAIVGDKPAMVFWSCLDGDVSLYNHLRRLGHARLPTWAALGKPGPDPGNPADLAPETTMFRHWDPTVLGALLPLLDAAQFARILGPASEVAYCAPDNGGVKRVVADPDWPIAPAGILTIRGDQMEALTARRVEAQRRRVGVYLRDVTRGDLAAASDTDIQAHVMNSERSAKDLGIATEAGRCRWAYLMYTTRGEAAQRPEIVGYIQTPGRNPDVAVEELMGEAIRAMKRTAART